MGSEIDQLNSIDNFFGTDELSIALRIKRDLFNYLQKKAGDGLFSRSSSGFLNKYENEPNSDLTDILIKTQVVEAVGQYNTECPSDLKAIVGSDMVAIKREDNWVQILVVFVPMQSPSTSSISSLVISVPTVGG